MHNQPRKEKAVTGTGSARDGIVNLLVRAIQTGHRDELKDKPRPKTEFTYGCSHAYGRSAAVITHITYGTDYDATKDLYRARVRVIRREWSSEDTFDPKRVAEAAEALLEAALDLLPSEATV
jgi:hypothetical protein